MAAERRDWTVSPGELLAELLEERGLSQSELARRMGRPIKTINEIVNGKAAVTPQTAIQLERVLGVPARFWISAESAYRYDLARFEEHKVAEEAEPWLREFPVEDLVKFGLIHDAPPQAQFDELLKYFEVGSPQAWEAKWAHVPVALRASRAHRGSRYARAAWFRWGEKVAGEVEVAPFDEGKLRLAIGELRALSLVSPPEAAVDELRERLAEVGVAFALTPELAGTRLSGAARWLRRGPLVQVSGRHRSDDQFWFTVTHECWHLLDSPGSDFADHEPGDPRFNDEDDEIEERVNRLARESLVPSAELDAFLAEGPADDPARVRALARSLGVAPGLVVGRLQYDRHVSFEKLNGLKHPFVVE